MKSILISMQADPNYLIETHKKTLDLRKTKPIISPPFKVYIYEALGYRMKLSNVCKGRVWRGLGKVTGEFICDDIDTVAVFNNVLYSEKNSQANKLAQLCLTIDEIKSYLGQKNHGYIWHISDLVIYDRPKELSEFSTPCKMRERLCGLCDYAVHGMDGDLIDCNTSLTRPPQSWCYVEERSRQ